jgi:general secretion pathway protein E/type IV pilus assembly protein PilB
VGYSGRIGLFELLVSSDEVRQLAHDRASTWEIKDLACKQGMLTLREDGWYKVLDGETSIDELLWITKSDRGVPQSKGS